MALNARHFSTEQVSSDIKPSNIIISTDGELKLLDLGLGRFLEGAFSDAHSGQAAPVAREDSMPGTHAAEDFVPPMPADNDLAWMTPPSGKAYAERYRAPEVKEAAMATERSDVYSVGRVLYELLCGDLNGQTTEQGSVELRPLRQAASDIDPRLAAIVERCLLPDPAQRFSSADELRTALEQLLPSAQADSLPEGNPYRGLLAFEGEHRGLFFGRRSEVGTVLERLRTEACVLVAAESGVGKSSLCRAGVLPLVSDGALSSSRAWKVALMVPGRYPLRTLAGILAEALSQDERKLQAKLEAAPTTLSRELNRMTGERIGLVLFVDQLEELVTIANPQEARIVSEALGELLTRTPCVRLLMTARSDFLGRIALLPGIGEAVTRSLYILRPLGPERLREVVVGPAQAKGVMFESPGLVTSLVESSAHADGGLPLLQFALTELWDARVGNQITASALEGIGGVTGALARHADQVVGSLPPPQRMAARRLLVALVTLEGTRARRTEEELTAGHIDVAPVLEALVKGRLLVACDTAEGTAYEVAHEALIKGWATLQQWLEQYSEARAVRHRLETATAEWRRLGRPREALWSGQQLAETVLLESEAIGPREREFLAASHKLARRRQRIRNLILVAVPLGMAAIYAAAQYQARRDLGQRMARDIISGTQELSAARDKDQQVNSLYTQAYALFDSQKLTAGESAYAQAQELALEEDRAFGRASQFFETVVTTDHANVRARDLLGDTLYERALIAERDRRKQQLEDLLQRLALYDANGSRRARWDAPGHVHLKTTPAAKAVLQRYEKDARRRLFLKDEKDLGTTPIADLPLSPGSYLLTLSAPGRIEVKYPFLVARGTAQEVDLSLPEAKDVPPGFAYVPPGTFLVGSSSDETVRQSFLATVPIHPIRTGAYLIARNETTYGEWLEYLNALPVAERAQYLVAAKAGLTGSMSLKQLPDGVWQISLQQAGGQVLTAKAGEPIVYSARTQRKTQNWLRMPVGGVSFEQAKQYARWLSAGRLPGARLCDELEWERAARGADERDWPQGDELSGKDANYDETYDKNPVAMGPDEVGSYPASRSPFGVDDLVGNAYEWTYARLSKDESVIRGGNYWYAAPVVLSTNRQIVDSSLRDPGIGFRICVSMPGDKRL